MDWLRRNWPDLLIGVALVMVIAMIVVTLLSGGSLASLVRRDTPQPLATDAGTGAAATADGSSGTAGNSGDTTDTSSSSDAATTTDGTDTAQAEDGYDVFVPGVPGRDETTADGGRAGDQNTNETDAGLSSDASASSSTGAGEGTTGDDALPTASRTGSFRVAAGATNSRDGARTLAQSYRDSGLEVAVEQKNNLYLLWVGPYQTRADADAAAGRIIADGGDALVYNYGGESADAEAATDTSAGTSDATPTGTTSDDPSSSENTGDVEAGTLGTENAAGGEGAALANNAGANAAANAASAGNATPRTPGGGTAASGTASNTGAEGAAAENRVVAEDLAAGAESGQRYLQVGAFASDQSAEPRREQLGQLGLAVTSSETDNGLLRLFVGPYGEAQMTQIQTRLNAQGIESFPVSQ